MKTRHLHEIASALFDGGDEEDRTLDLCLAKAALSQLSYIPMWFD
jgi:hypothetical protein